MDTSDAIAAVGAVTGIGALLYSVLSGRRAGRAVDRSVTAAERSAAAAERSAQAADTSAAENARSASAAEQQTEIMRQQVAVLQAAAAVLAEGSIPATDQLRVAPVKPEPPAGVAWRLTRANRTWRLRNIGLQDAVGVTVTGLPTGSGILHLMSDVNVVPAGHALEVAVMPVAELPDVNALEVRWGADQSQVLPLD